MAQNSLETPYPPDNLLVTKLEIPLLGYRIIQRSRLTALLQSGLKRQVTLIVAQAGYGKTTLLVEWFSTYKPVDWRVAWLSLDPSDNTPLRFWSYVAASLQKISPRLHINSQQIIQLGYDPQGILQLNSLFNEIEKFPHPVCLILDNYEAIKDENIHKGLAYLIDHQPNNLRLIIASRAIPPIPLARLRVERQLVEITEQNLSFTLHEANAFLTGVMELDLTPDKVAALVDATEGWIAGLQLAALSMHGRPDFQPLQDHLQNDNRQILAYLTEEVLNQQDDDIRDFLLKTSVLTEFSAPLCDALLDRTDSQSLLNRIEQANLFVTSLDELHVWYRYHPLFAEALRGQLTRLHPDLVIEQHRKAYAWLRENGYPEKAVSHALAAGDLEKAAEIADECAMQVIFDLDLTNLIQWINRFPDALLRARPRLGIYYSLACFLIGRLDLIETKLQVIEQVLQEPRNVQISDEDEKLLRWEISAIRAVMDCTSGDFDRGISSIQELAKTAPEGDQYFMGFMSHWLAESHDSAGYLDIAATEFGQAVQFAATHNLIVGIIHSGCELARIRKAQGRLVESLQEYQKAYEFSIQFGKEPSLIALAQTGIVLVELERMDAGLHTRWMQEITENYDQIEAGALIWNNMVWISLRLASYFVVVNDLDLARKFLQKAMQGLEKTRQPKDYLPLEFIDVQVRIWQASGGFNALDGRFEEQITRLNPSGRPNVAQQAALARLYLAQSKPAQALAILTDLEVVTRSTGQGERLIETLVLQALAFKADGQLTQALACISQAIELAEPEGYTRLFVDEGEPMKTLLQAYQSGSQLGKSTAFLQKLLQAFEHPSAAPSVTTQPELPQTSMFTPLLAPLSGRELEVLQMLAAGKSAKEMATTLMISINTVKTHIKSIYRKLGGHSRKVVFQRVNELGLLPPADDK